MCGIPLARSLVIVTSDHGETLHDHECWYDHHGLYECALVVPLVLRWPGRFRGGCGGGDRGGPPFLRGGGVFPC